MTPEDFTAIYDANAHHVRNLAYRLIGPEEADDVAQQVWLRVFRFFGQFRGDAVLSSWLYRVTVNVARDHYRHSQRRPLGHAVSADVLEFHHAPGLSPDERITRQEQRAEVRRRLSALDPIFRRALIGHLAGLSLDEVAARDGISRGAAKSRTFRARHMVTEAR